MRRDGHFLKVGFAIEKNLPQHKRFSLFGERKLSLPETPVWSDALIAGQLMRSQRNETDETVHDRT
jgi:hypothetical protein